MDFSGLVSYYASRNRDSTAPREFLVFPFNSLDLVPLALFPNTLPYIRCYYY